MEGLTVDVLADVFPLNAAAFVVPLSIALPHHLTTVLPGVVAEVIGLALHPEPEAAGEGEGEGGKVAAASPRPQLPHI